MPTSHPESILLLGAGELGNQILLNLAKHHSRGSTQLSLLLRPSAIATEDGSKKAQFELYKQLGVSFVPGDILHATQAELTTLFAKFDAVIGCTGMTLPPGTQTKIAHAALEARIPKFVPWQFGLDYDAIEKNTKHDLFSEQVAIRNTLRAQSVTDWVIVSTGMFLSFIFEPDFGLVDLEEGKVEAIGSWDNTITVNAVEDIGKVVSELLFVTPEETGIVYISGDSISMRRLASLVEQLLGREIEKSLRTVPELEQDLVEDPDNKMGKCRTTFASGIGYNWDAANTYTARRNLETISVKAWAKKNLEI